MLVDSTWAGSAGLGMACYMMFRHLVNQMALHHNLVGAHPDDNSSPGTPALAASSRHPRRGDILVKYTRYNDTSLQTSR